METKTLNRNPVGRSDGTVADPLDRAPQGLERSNRERPAEEFAPPRPESVSPAAVTAGPPPGPAGAPEKSGKRPPRWLFIAGAVILVLAIFFGVRWYIFNLSHVGTDDAQVDGNIYPMSPQVSGNVLQVTVENNQLVKKGDLLVQIDPRNYQAALEQAQANLNAAKARTAAARAQVAVTQQTTGAGVSNAQAALQAAQANVNVKQTQLATAQEGVQAALATLNSAIHAQQTALHAIASSDAQVRSAQAQYRSMLAGGRSAQANQKKVATDAARYRTLYQQGAIAAQQYDAQEAALVTANAQVQQAEQAGDQAADQISQMEASAESARSAAEQAGAAVQQARVGVQQAEDNVASARANVTQAEAQVAQAQSELLSAQSAPVQVRVQTGTAQSSSAQVAQAQAAVDQADLQLSYCRITAPVDGYISEKNVDVGQSVQPGQALLAVVPLSDTYVTANFKETQMTNMKIGDPAEFTVDAYPGQTFRGSVESIASGTGSEFSLLPPENATGNFVKVVQRIPVRIKIDQSSDPNHLLRLGMSVTVTVDTGH